MQVSRLDRNWIVVRPNGYQDEGIIKMGTNEWSDSEHAFICPRPRIVELVDYSRKDNLQCEYDDELYRMEKMAKIAFESNLAALRAMRQTGARSEDIDYFRDHFKGKFLPYRHQLVTFMYATLIDCCGVLNEMGTGKTASVLWAFDQRRISKEVYNGLIVAPNNILQNWQKEVSIHTPHLKTVILQGSRNERLDLLDSFADLFIINYEGLRVLEDDIKYKFQMVILDEAHKIKDPSAGQTKLCHKIFDGVPYKVAMTGTPIGNELLDLHQIMTWLDPFMFEPYHMFRAKYFYAAGSKFKPKHGTEKMMQDRVYTRAIRYRKEECLDLPPKNYITRTCKLDGPQAIAYQQMLKQFITAMDEGLITAKNVLSQIMKLSQITSGFVRDGEGKDHVFRRSAKLDLLESVVDEIGARKIVHWARFIPDIKRVSKMLNAKEGRKALMLYGATAKGGKALDIVDQFQQDPSITDLVGNPAVGGLGLNMTAAKYAIYYSNDYSWIKRSQSEDRIHRMGSEQHDSVFIFDLVCEKTIDEPVVGALRNKKELAHVIIDMYHAGITDAFGLIRERREAEEKMVGAAKNLAAIQEFIDLSRKEYSGAVELMEPECPECHSKAVVPHEGQMKCRDCEAVYD